MNHLKRRCNHMKIIFKKEKETETQSGMRSSLNQASHLLLALCMFKDGLPVIGKPSRSKSRKQRSTTNTTWDTKGCPAVCCLLLLPSSLDPQVPEPGKGRGLASMVTVTSTSWMRWALWTWFWVLASVNPDFCNFWENLIIPFKIRQCLLSLIHYILGDKLILLFSNALTWWSVEYVGYRVTVKQSI